MTTEEKQKEDEANAKITWKRFTKEQREAWLERAGHTKDCSSVDWIFLPLHIWREFVIYDRAYNEGYDAGWTNRDEQY